ncbi:MAG: hypothetical protein U0790_08340 [Isosphaeraceae bacterium]
MERTPDLRGRWTGHYHQHSRPHPISLDLDQDGENLSGSMTDGDTDRDLSVFEATAEAGMPPGEDERLVARLTELFPDAEADSIRYVSHLPPRSSVEGRVRGSTISFIKRYEGTHFGGYRVGEHLVVHVDEGHTVHYQGRLSPNGRELEGRWWIESDPSSGRPRNEGTFELRR